jgi:hypothetical protein
MRKQRLAGIPPCTNPAFRIPDEPVLRSRHDRPKERSNGHVVRLEPFFATAPVAAGGPTAPALAKSLKTGDSPGASPWGRARQAAALIGAEAVVGTEAVVGAGAVAAVDSKRTDTRFDTPDSSIVTP